MQPRLRHGRAATPHSASFEAITEQAPVGIFTTSDKGDCTFVNERWCELAGITVEQALGKGWGSALHPDDRERVFSQWYRCADEHIPFSAEYRFQTPDGRVNWVYGKAVRLHGDDGRAEGFAGCIWDVTERKHAELTLQRVVDAVTPITGLDFFRSLANQVCLACDVDYVIVDTFDKDDPGQVRTLACSHLGQLLDNYTHELRDTPCEKVLDSSFRHYVTGVRQTFPFDHHLDRMGADSYMGVPLFSASGRALGLISLLHGRPIARPQQAEAILRVVAGRAGAEVERELTEAALRESEDLLRGLVETSPVPMLVISLPEHRVLMMNTRFTEVFGYSHREVGTADDWWPLAYPDPPYRARVRQVWFERIAEANAAGRTAVLPLDARVTCRDGQERQVEVQLGLYGNRGLVVFNDLTDRLRLESELHHAQKMQAIGQLAGGVAHDFNNLLTVINGYSDLLALRTSDDETVRESVNAIRGAGERAARLTQQLLLFSHKARLEPRLLNLNDSLEQTAAILRRLIGEDVAISATMAPTLDRVRVDPSQIEQVLLNLSLNARDAMPNGGQLSIETRNATLSAREALEHPGRRAGRYVQLMVSDTGVGMQPDVQARIFEPFFTTKGPGRGTGLGLATVYGIVQQNGGFITVTSEVGAGSRFTIWLPAVEGETLPDAAPDVADLARLKGHETILLVEDEEAVRRVARLTLEMQGYRVIEASSGRQALELARDAPAIDLILTDVVMPEMSGRQVAEAMRRHRPGTRVLFMSGYDKESVGLQSPGGDSSDDVLQKPFTPLSLARRIRYVLDATA
jgi:two-component system cell cycle sensor histidine kinase/response regulator CckA